MKKSDIDTVGIIGAAASVGALLLVFYFLKYPSSSPSKSIVQSSVPMVVGQPLQNTQGQGGSSDNLPVYDNEPSSGNVSYNIGGDNITSDFCSSCN